MYSVYRYRRQSDLSRETSYTSSNSSSMEIKGTDNENSPGAQVDAMVKHPTSCRVANMVKTPAKSRVSVLVQGPTIELQVAEAHPHLIRQRLAMIASGLCDVTANNIFTLLVASWSKPATTPPKIMIVTQCATPSVVLCAMPTHDNSVNMPHLYRELERLRPKSKN